MRFGFVNTNKPCCNKARASEKGFISQVFDQLIVTGNNSLIVKLLTNVNFANCFKKVFLAKLLFL